jgi:hypothetical protein
MGMRTFGAGGKEFKAPKRVAFSNRGTGMSLSAICSCSAGGLSRNPRSLIGRRVSLIALGVRASDLRKTVEGSGGDGRAKVVKRPIPVGRTAWLRRIARVRGRSLRIGRIVWSRNNGRMLEQTRRISVFRRQSGIRRHHGNKHED